MFRHFEPKIKSGLPCSGILIVLMTAVGVRRARRTPISDINGIEIPQRSTGMLECAILFNGRVRGSEPALIGHGVRWRSISLLEASGSGMLGFSRGQILKSS